MTIDKRFTEMLTAHLKKSDAVLLTGGVSMGDYDYVPDVVREVGGEVVFHGLPIRPGKPILGAATNEGKLIIGLPGNPVTRHDRLSANGIATAGKAKWTSRLATYLSVRAIIRCRRQNHTFALVATGSTDRAWNC